MGVVRWKYGLRVIESYIILILCRLQKWQNYALKPSPYLTNASLSIFLSKLRVKQF